MLNINLRKIHAVIIVCISMLMLTPCVYGKEDELKMLSIIEKIEKGMEQLDSGLEKGSLDIDKLKIKVIELGYKKTYEEIKFKVKPKVLKLDNLMMGRQFDLIIYIMENKDFFGLDNEEIKIIDNYLNYYGENDIWISRAISIGNESYKLKSLIDGKSKEESLIEIMRWLCNRGIDLNKIFILHTAAFFGSSKLIQLMAKAELEIDINAIGDDGKTALHVVASSLYGNQETVEALIEFGADINAFDRNNNTPLDLAKKMFAYINASTLRLSIYDEYKRNAQAIIKLLEDSGALTGEKVKEQGDQSTSTSGGWLRYLGATMMPH